MGIMITASHNPYYDNGLKLFGPDGLKLSDNIERKIEKLIDSKIINNLSKPEILGRVKRLENGNDNSVYALGHKTWTNLINEPTVIGYNPWGSDIILSKFNEVGTKIWSKEVLAGESESVNGMASDSDGSVYIYGRTTKRSNQ